MNPEGLSQRWEQELRSGRGPREWLTRDHLWIAKLHLQESEWLLTRKKSVSTETAAGVSAADHALAINPDAAEAYAARGALLSFSDDPAVRQSAKVVLDRALAINPNLKRQYLKYAHPL